MTSYRQLPVTLYQIRTKFRDEIRPRFGLMRGREFLMYDGYSFDVDAEGLDRSYKAQDAAYRRIFERCGLDFTVVQADSGAIGGTASEEFMVLADTGEDAVVRCAACGYGANLEKAETGPRPAPWKDETEAPLVEVRDARQGRHRRRRRVPRDHGLADDQVPRLRDREGLRRGAAARRPRRQRGRPEERARRSTTSRSPPRTRSRRPPGAPVGYVGPHKLPAENVRIVADESIRDAVNAVTGRRPPRLARRAASSSAATRRSQAWGGFAQARVGDPCPRCGKPLDIARGIEVGHIFKLGTKYSEALGCEFTDEKGETRPAVMGTYGIGVGRTMAAAVEQHHDADGIVWPLALAPFEIALVSLNPTDEADRGARPTRSTTRCVGAGLDVFYDDRDERPGVKFKDADLIGFPIRVNVGGRALKEGNVEIVPRRDKSVRAGAETAEALEAVKALRGGARRETAEAPCGR